MKREIPRNQSSKDEMCTAVKALRRAIEDSDVPVSDLTIAGRVDNTGVTINDGWPTSLKPGIKKVRWLLERSTESKSVDSYLWRAVKKSWGKIANRLQDVNDLLRKNKGAGSARMQRIFNRLLGRELSEIRFEKRRNAAGIALQIDYLPFDYQLVKELHDATLLWERTLEGRSRDPEMDKRDELIFEDAHNPEMKNWMIAKKVNELYPDHQILESRVSQIITQQSVKQGRPHPRK
jgi:hypothetical protein